MAVATLYLVHVISIRGMEVPLILQRLHDSGEVIIIIVVSIILPVFVSSTVSGSSNAHHFYPVFFVSSLYVVVEILVFILCVFPAFGIELLLVPSTKAPALVGSTTV